jgi:hypothetical protein
MRAFDIAATQKPRNQSAKEFLEDESALFHNPVF